MKEKVILAWSGGKDSALALYELQKSKRYEIVSLLTTINRDYDRVSMHGVRRNLLRLQANSLNIFLESVFSSKNDSDEKYEAKMRNVLAKYAKTGVYSVAFGDIFLEDVRKYRQKNLSKIKMNALFPLWKRDTLELANEFINLGFKTIITCVDTNAIDKKFVGRVFDRLFLFELPTGVDPCGENGEFHSFVYGGPMFRNKISLKTGELVLRENRFYYCDLVSVQSDRAGN
jgi:uncharacterized protein (TIGR00290 family)